MDDNNSNQITANQLHSNITAEHSSQNSTIPSNFIEVIEGKFKCSECENISVPETNTAEGVVTADLLEIDKKFNSNPGKKLIIYGVCPVCGMEYEFRQLNGNLYLEPSSMMK